MYVQQNKESESFSSNGGTSASVFHAIGMHEPICFEQIEAPPVAGGGLASSEPIARPIGRFTSNRFRVDYVLFYVCKCQPERDMTEYLTEQTRFQ